MVSHWSRDVSVKRVRERRVDKERPRKNALLPWLLLLPSVLSLPAVRRKLRVDFASIELSEFIADSQNSVGSYLLSQGAGWRNKISSSRGCFAIEFSSFGLPRAAEKSPLTSFGSAAVPLLGVVSEPSVVPVPFIEFIRK